MNLCIFNTILCQLCASLNIIITIAKIIDSIFFFLANSVVLVRKAERDLHNKGLMMSGIVNVHHKEKGTSSICNDEGWNVLAAKVACQAIGKSDPRWESVMKIELIYDFDMKYVAGPCSVELVFPIARRF